MSSSGEGFRFKILQKNCSDYALDKKKFHDMNKKNHVYESMKKRKLQHVLEHEKN